MEEGKKMSRMIKHQSISSIISLVRSWFSTLFPLLWASQCLFTRCDHHRPHILPVLQKRPEENHRDSSQTRHIQFFFLFSCQKRWDSFFAIFAPMLCESSINKLQSCEHRDCASGTWLYGPSVLSWQRGGRELLSPPACSRVDRYTDGGGLPLCFQSRISSCLSLHCPFGLQRDPTTRPPAKSVVSHQNRKLSPQTSGRNRDNAEISFVDGSLNLDVKFLNHRIVDIRLMGRTGIMRS